MVDIAIQHVRFTEWVALFVALCPILLLSRVIYNLFFHPLAHIPGPIWARASGFPSWYHATRGRRHIWMWQNFQVYGNRVRAAPNLVLFCDPDSYTDIYGLKSNVRRSRFYDGFTINEEISTLTTSDVALHARKRKILNQCFNEKSIRAASGFVVKHVDRWHQLLVDERTDLTEWSKTIEFSDELEKLTFDIMGDLSFGKSFGLKEPGDNPLKAIPNAIADFMRFQYSINQSPLLNIFLYLKPRGLDKIFDIIAPPTVRKYNEFVADNIKNRIELQKEQEGKPEDEKRLDMFHFLIGAKDLETGLPALDHRDLKAESSLLIVAGTDTSANSLSGIFFYLTGDPRRCRKVVNEVRMAFKSVDDIVYSPELSACTYLRACIDEGMRMVPSGPGEFPREVLPGGIQIKGEYYPAGTIVGFSHWTGRRSQEVYGDPEVFRPERWIEDESSGVTAESVARMRSNFHPFLTGPGNCVGRHLAMMEMMVILARTLYRFDIRRAPGSTFGGGSPELGWGSRDRNQMQIEEAYISLRHGPEVQLRRRAT